MIQPKSFTEKILNVFVESRISVTVLVVVLGFVSGTFLVILVGKNPAGMYAGILQTLTGWDITRGTWNIRYVGEWIATSIPLILCGLSFAFAARTGLFNIGAEGQYIAGLTAAQLVALLGPKIPFLHMFLAVSAGIIAGAMWGMIAGYLKARFEVSEVVATIMLNYIAFFLSRWLTGILPDASTYRTADFPETARLSSSFLEFLTNGSRLNNGLWFTIAAIFVYWVIMERTKAGFTLRATGYNKNAAKAAGISVGSAISASMAVSGAFAGLAGAIVALGSFSFGRVISSMDNYGFDGIAVALVGSSTTPGTTVAGFLFGMLNSARPLMQSRGIPKEIALIISGLVVVLISLRAAFKFLGDVLSARKTVLSGNPKAQGAEK